jgi:hypothetical protein
MNRKQRRILILIVAMFSLNGFLSAGEILDINGSFSVSNRKDGIPVGWEANGPTYWDDAATVALNLIEGKDGQALQITTPSKAIHLYSNGIWPISTGDQCVIKAMIKGKGEGALGIYVYPGCGLVQKTFQATEEWTEFAAKVTVPKVTPAIGEMRVVIVASPGSSVEFLNVTAEIVK